nr:uncharacterized protein LOC118877083 isoform X2 [Drosophila suzukii]
MMEQQLEENQNMNADLAVWNSERGRHEREKAVQRYFELHACNNVDDNILKHKSHQFCNNLYYNWLKCHSSYKNFETKHSTWMKGNTTLPLKKSNRPVDKQAMLKRKASIQEMFWAKLALKVDKPKQGGFGNTNTGNTARRAFANFKKFSEITGVDQQIIYNLRIILICLSCQLPINLEKFEAYCHQTGEMIVDSYPWLPMTPTLHKIIVHSRQIMENTVLPVGCFGEEASESRNKIYKSDRLHHSRKHSRFESLGDVFKRALDTSDPVISSLNLSRRIKKHKNLSLPIEVIQLLSCEHEYISDFSEQDELEDNSLFFLENFELENEENDENKEN